MQMVGLVPNSGDAALDRDADRLLEANREGADGFSDVSS
jgi:hypothetical protein